MLRFESILSFDPPSANNMISSLCVVTITTAGEESLFKRLLDLDVLPYCRKMSALGVNRDQIAIETVRLKLRFINQLKDCEYSSSSSRASYEPDFSTSRKG